MAFGFQGYLDIAVDLGSNNTRVYVKDRGIAVNEPSILIVRGSNPGVIEAIGNAAQDLIGRMSSDSRVVYPVRDGVIVDYEMAQHMIYHFVEKAVGYRKMSKLRAVVTIPGGLNKVEHQTVLNVFDKIGVRQVFLVEHAFASAQGTGLPVYEPIGSVIVDIGAGTTEVAVISMGGIVISKTIKVAGNRIDGNIVAFLRKEYDIQITERIASRIKMDLSDMQFGFDGLKTCVVRGRDIATGLPITVDVDREKLVKVVRDTLDEVLDVIRWVLERTPPEIAADVLQNGIVLSGGSAQLPNLNRIIADEFGIKVSAAKNPAECAIRGIGAMADRFDLFNVSDKGEH